MNALTSFYKQVRLTFRLATSYISVNWKFFLLGILVSAALAVFLPSALNSFFRHRPKVIGLVGNYTVSTLPQDIQSQISEGLTKIEPDGQATGAAALSWTATDSGKLVTFILNPNLHWQDGQSFTSQDVNYNLKSVTLTHPDPTTIVFQFKDPFAPLPTIVSQPLFKDGLLGLGDSRVENISLNGRFISTLSLRNIHNQNLTEYKFYPSEAGLVTALKLGNIQIAEGLHTTQNIETDNHYHISATVDPRTVATIFFNTDNDLLSDRIIRQALAYALPNTYSEGDRAYSPLPQDSWVGTAGTKEYLQNLDAAKSTLEKKATNSAQLALTLSTNETLLPVAQTIATAWRAVGVQATINVTDILPSNYDAYLAYLEVPSDPDQYMLWHSTQEGNITHYKSPKIDKLLEDGRKTLDFDTRLNIYQNFQKAITEELPAIFLYYPKLYTVTRL